MNFDINTIADICRPHNDKLIAEGRAAKLERENAKLRAALEVVKGVVVGDRAPHWIEDGYRVTITRGQIADICDIALGTAA